MPQPIFLLWLGIIITLVLLLVILLEISRNNEKREHEVMFGSKAFDEKSKLFALTEKESHTMEKLVRRSVFSNKDALFNSANLFEDAVNRFYEFRKLDAIREITLSSVTDLRKKLGFTISNPEVSLVSTRQFEKGTFLKIVIENKEFGVSIQKIDEKKFVLELAETEFSLINIGDICTIRWTRPGDAVYTVHVKVIGKLGNRISFQHESSIEKFQLRRWVREDVDFEVLVENTKTEGRLFDLSAGGILLGLSEEYPEKTLLRISFEMPGYGYNTVQIQILRQLNKKNEKYPDLFLHTALFVGNFGAVQEKILQYIFEVRRKKIEKKELST